MKCVYFKGTLIPSMIWDYPGSTIGLTSLELTLYNICIQAFFYKVAGIGKISDTKAAM